jgi:hypothetical protein
VPIREGGDNWGLRSRVVHQGTWVLDSSDATPGRKAAKDYGVLALALYTKRWTFYVDREGSSSAPTKPVDTETAGQDVAARLDEPGYSGLE